MLFIMQYDVCASWICTMQESQILDKRFTVRQEVDGLVRKYE
jgi:hypothetical protein